VWKVDSAFELGLLIDTLVERDRKLRSAASVAREEADLAEAQALAGASKPAGEDSVETETSDTSELAPHWLTDYHHSDRRLSAVAIATAIDAEPLDKVVIGTEAPVSTTTTGGGAATSSGDDDEKSKAAAAERELQQLENAAHGVMSDKFLASPFIFQEFIGYTKGRDLRVLVMRGKVIGAMMRRA
jgi:hypothetical protein